jgi:Domain of unknown function (DUF4844)
MIFGHKGLEGGGGDVVGARFSNRGASPASLMPDQTLLLTPGVLERLSALWSEMKFRQENLYPGAPTKDIRQNAERALNAMLDRLRVCLQLSPRKSYVLSEFLEMLKAFDHADTEEREQACAYCERVMNVLGVESSDGLLNIWLYGFDPERRAR